MRIVEIRDESAFDALRDAWRLLVDSVPAATTFVTWEWMRAWWAAYGTPGDLRIFAAYDSQGTLRGIAPLRCRRQRRYGQNVTIYSFIGDGSNDSDYLDFIAAPGLEGVAVESFLSHLSPELDRGALIEWNEAPASSASLSFLREHARQAGEIWTESDVPCGVVTLPATWDEYLGTLKPRFRTKVRSVLRQNEARPEVAFGFCTSPDEAAELLPVLFDLHTRRWQTESKPGVFGGSAKREFYARLSERLLERDWLRLSWLKWNGTVLACQYGFVLHDRYFQLQEGYEPNAEHLNLGLALRAWTIREYIGQKIHTYDFMGGVGRHKLDWGASVELSKRIQYGRMSAKNLIVCRGPQLAAWTREQAGRLIPERVLETRRSLLLRKSMESGTSSGWKQQTAARLYFNLGLPGLMRPLRERYQAEILRNGSGPKLRVRRRSEGCGRIFCYHRVNDRHDPFQPAMPTEVFEQEIRYVAKHHNVVSLSELLRKLQSGSTESMVALTFDDGYRDNYENAFPILRRYGLTGTVFLATSGMDTQEPLWFDRLGLAVKQTTKEHLDVDAGNPRRFWLRTPEERIQARDDIRHFLRALPDRDRVVLLKEILRDLGLRDESELQEQMLTWPQVREMRAAGMDFGGHTVTHPFVSRLERTDLEWEVTECKRRIEAETQAPVTHFAYPNGRAEDFSTECKEVLRTAGYEAAVTTLWGLNYAATDVMELRRGSPWEEDPAMFACKLDWYQLVNG